MTTYTVMPGDTMWGIASKHAIGLNELLEANPQIKKSSFIFPGQKINIPNGTKSTYTVAPGDTMWNIAKKQGVELSKLIAANPQITNSSLIIPGQKVNIPDETTTSDDVRSLETEVIRLVNEERRRAGRPALVENSELSRIGRIKSNDFISNNYFSHNSPTYGTPFDMLRSFGISFTAAAENIAKGQGTATDVMNTWMNSQGHRANILNTTYNQIGVGVARDNNGVLYWTQMFIRS
ncbi:MAG TPA: LysM peptidoglycan-binding domain-containing protein [Mollicutes bacterium]|nr:LysM peptidoglycan-binding domain-containing protein [Mollicutes bacterium]